MRILRAAAGALALSYFGAACTIGPQGGADAGDAAAATGTIGDQCSKIWSQYCARAVACLVTDDQSGCLSNYINLCCSTKCSHPAVTPDVRINACASDVSMETCNDVAQGANALPQSCAGIPQEP